tara:strand:- start:491 stop:1489 length:999 start_codon:yes stop_codon:yes gene_type:complete
MSPKVTIIVPVYNTARYLVECIKSLENLDFDSYEVIFIDNNSKDDSFKILKNIKKKHFRIYKNKKNYGQSYSLNKGIHLSKAPYIAIMDSDDICLSNRIKDSYNFLKNNQDYTLVAGMSDTINSSGKILKKRRFTLDPDLLKIRILIENPISHTTAMFKKSNLKKLGGYSTKLNYTQDYHLFSKIILNNFKFKILNKKFTLVRKHAKQQSFLNRKKQLIENLEISIENLRKKNKDTKDYISFIKLIIFSANRTFEKINVLQKKKTINNFLKKTFINDKFRFYFCSLIFSRKINLEKKLKLHFLMNYLFKNNFLFFKKEVAQRFCKSFLNVIF